MTAIMHTGRRMVAANDNVPRTDADRCRSDGKRLGTVEPDGDKGLPTERASRSWSAIVRGAAAGSGMGS